MLAYIKIRVFLDSISNLRQFHFFQWGVLYHYTRDLDAPLMPLLSIKFFDYIFVWRIELFGFSKESKRCTRLPPYQLSLELCLVSLWIKLNEGRMHFVRHNVCCWNLVLYRTYIIIKSTSSRKCKDDCVSEEQIRTILKIFEGL